MVYVPWIVSISSIAISPVKVGEKALRGGYTKFEPGKGIFQINACWLVRPIEKDWVERGRVGRPTGSYDSIPTSSVCKIIENPASLHLIEPVVSHKEKHAFNEHIIFVVQGEL